MFDDFLDRYLLSGGVMMAPLALCAFLAIGFALQGMFRLRRGRVLPRALFRQAREAATASARRAFVDAQADANGIFSRAIWATFKDAIPRDGGLETPDLDAAIERASSRAADELEDAAGPLQTIYSVAPLLGFIGTLHGMIEALAVYDSGAAKQSPVLISGLQEALVATFWSLPIALVALLAAQWLAGRVRRYERREIPAALRIMNKVLRDSIAEKPQAPEAARSESAAPRPMSTTTLFTPGTAEAAVLGRARTREEP